MVECREVLNMPRNTTSRVFFYTYVLESERDENLYIGTTTNLNQRLKEHNKGYSFSTKFRRPFRLIYVEACLNGQDAARRERYLKTTQGRRFLGLRLQEYRRKSRGTGG
jgi:putative endonuclease